MISGTGSSPAGHSATGRSAIRFRIFASSVLPCASYWRTCFAASLSGSTQNGEPLAGAAGSPRVEGGPTGPFGGSSSPQPVRSSAETSVRATAVTVRRDIRPPGSGTALRTTGGTIRAIVT